MLNKCFGPRVKHMLNTREDTHTYDNMCIFICLTHVENICPTHV